MSVRQLFIATIVLQPALGHIIAASSVGGSLKGTKDALWVRFSADLVGVWSLTLEGLGRSVSSTSRRGIIICSASSGVAPKKKLHATGDLSSSPVQ